MLQDVVVAINGAMQMLQRAGQDFFTRDTITINLGAGTSLYQVTKSVQAILGPIRLNNLTPLSALTSRGELDQFDRIFLGSTSFGAAAGTPVAYWVENIKSGSTGNINQINIWLVPVPTGGGTIVAEVVDDAAAYVVADLSGSTNLPVAQNYTESVFLPIARMLICRSSQFSRPDILQGLTTDYEAAMATLATAGGFPNAVEPQPERKVDA